MAFQLSTGFVDVVIACPLKSYCRLHPIGPRLIFAIPVEEI